MSTAEARATRDQVLDQRTLKILRKLKNKGIIQRMYGAISTGKEANVYYATSLPPTKKIIHDQTSSNTTGVGLGGASSASLLRHYALLENSSDNLLELAVKIYKTSILVFKDRAKYAVGEWRFEQVHYSKNPRKMVRQWALKEMRNLNRIYTAGIPCPIPLIIIDNVLVMTFIGRDGAAARRLADVQLSNSKYRLLYLQAIKIMRKLFQECNLIHADLSEYNILYMKSLLYIIDVSQSVGADHINAFEFLRNDCINVTRFFRKRGVLVMKARELFNFVVDVTIGDTEEEIDQYLGKVQKKLENQMVSNSMDANTEEEDINDMVWKSAHIPRGLNELACATYDIESALNGSSNTFFVSSLFKGMDTSISLENSDDDSDEQDIISESEEMLVPEGSLGNAESIDNTLVVGNGSGSGLSKSPDPPLIDVSIDASSNGNGNDVGNRSSRNVEDLEGDSDESEDGFLSLPSLLEGRELDDLGNPIPIKVARKLSKQEWKKAMKKHKKIYKAERREQRKNKVPKKVKQQRRKRVASGNKAVKRK